MRSYSTILLSAILASLSLAEGGGETAEVSPVPKLKEAEFEKFITDNGLAMVKFFAPWCGHCKTMTEPYKLAGKQLKELNIKAAVAEVDCTEEAKLCETYKIGGYPTLKVFEASKKEPTDYKGGRDTESIVNFLQKMTEPAIKSMKADELKKLVEENKKDVIVAGRFPKGHAAYAVFEKAAENFKLEFTFVHVEGKEGSITVHKTFDELEVKLEKPLDKVTAEELIAFVKTESMPLIDEVGFENYEKYIEANKPMAYLFYETEEQKKTYGAMLMKVMKPYKGKINTVYISVEKFGEHAPRINLEKVWPGFVIHDLEANNKFPLTGKDKPALTEKALGDFVKQFVDGKLQPHFKSEPTPDAGAQKEAKIKTVVRNNFEDLILDKNRDVFLEVSSPHCGFCERNKPKMATLAEAFAPFADKIVITRMNGMENDLHPKAGFELQYFPTYLLYKANTNELVKFENTSGVKVEDFIKFVLDNASHKVEIDLAKYKSAEEAKASESESGASASGSDAGESSAGEHDEL